nr:cyclin-I2 isoform X2 [Pelodiscus sinensis]|eukprot:XP_006128583.1 cyclin-I2 isoform X2 [Pelodiscus sinensis]
MKCTGHAESQGLPFLLENALTREARIWKVPVFQNFTLKGTDISPSNYENAVLWIAELSSQFQFCSETFALAINILNRLLASVKAQVKYLRCIAITCLVLAAKTNEEDEVMPSVKKLAVQSGCKCSPAEILRMERIILDKLHWDLYTATPMDFLNIVSSIKFIHCKELVDQQLMHLQPSNAVYIFNPANQAIQAHPKEKLPNCYTEVKNSSRIRSRVTVSQPVPATFPPTSIKIHEDTMETDEFYDGFRNLYNEDGVPDGGRISITGSINNLRQEESSFPCPPLQPAEIN